jgi:3-deoxy-D-manno-octulosonic-acid transferase
MILILFDFQWARMRFAISEHSVIDSRKSILIHGASLGEMAIVKKLIPLVQQAYPDSPIIVSVTSPSGYKNISETMADSISHAVFLPVEFRWSIRRMLRFTNPKLIIITETELWPNFLLEAKSRNIRLILANGRMSDKTVPSYIRFKSIFAQVVQSFDKIGVQTEEYKKRYIAIGADPNKITVTGNLKEAIETSKPCSMKIEDARETLGLLKTHWLFIAASTRPDEEAAIIEAFVPLFNKTSDIILLIAPRHLKRMEQVEKLIISLGIPYMKKSEIRGSISGRTRIILLDTHGELAFLYNAGEAAFVGGTLVDVGGHNLLEPLSAMLPVVFGPSVYQQKASAEKLIQSDCGLMVMNANELANFVYSAYNDMKIIMQKKKNISRILQDSSAIIDMNRNLISPYV